MNILNYSLMSSLVNFSKYFIFLSYGNILSTSFLQWRNVIRNIERCSKFGKITTTMHVICTSDKNALSRVQ